MSLGIYLQRLLCSTQVLIVSNERFLSASRSRASHAIHVTCRSVLSFVRLLVQLVEDTTCLVGSLEAAGCRLVRLGTWNYPQSALPYLAIEFHFCF